MTHDNVTEHKNKRQQAQNTPGVTAGLNKNFYLINSFCSPQQMQLKKKILFRSSHRGTKEIDLLLGDFVRFNIHTLDLGAVESLLHEQDHDIYNWINHPANSPIKHRSLCHSINKYWLLGPKTHSS